MDTKQFMFILLQIFNRLQKGELSMEQCSIQSEDETDQIVFRFVVNGLKIDRSEQTGFASS